MNRFGLKQRRALVRALVLVAVASVAWTAAAAEGAQNGKPFVHPLFQDHMVLQRGIQAPVWGWTEPGSRVTVSMEGKRATAVAGKDGKWLARLGPFSAGGPYTLKVSGPQSATVNDVLVGDVWICSGQSNMEMGIGACNVPDAIAKADYPKIRLLIVPHKVVAEPVDVFESQWEVCSPQTVASGGWGGFSAAAYFFGRHLHEELNVPIGLIQTCWGGTIAEAWVSGEALEAMADFRPALEAVRQWAQRKGQPDADFEKLLAEWWRKNDPGSAASPTWADPAFDADAWKRMGLPGAWESTGLPNFDGIVWFRKAVDLPEAWAGKDLTLSLGAIDDCDTTYVNGVEVGRLDVWTTPRRYKVPGSAVKAGRNVIAVRVVDTGGGGGFVGQGDQMRLERPGNAASPMALAGPWQYCVAADLAKTAPMPKRLTGSDPNVVTVLYNGMIAPLVPYGVKGAIWYQGESNAGRGLQYRTLLATLIKDWQARFGVGDFPVLIVQLANFTAVKPEPGESSWAEVREAQLLTAQTVPNAGLAVAIDIGDALDIHPKNKQEVGRRLALSALAIGHGREIEFSGPVYRSMEVAAGGIRLAFDHVGGGLVAKGGKLTGFAIAGEDGKFVWADARIDGDTVVVSSPAVPQPKAVRYAWAENPPCNLYNKAGLPASPFRTDSPPTK